MNNLEVFECSYIHHRYSHVLDFREIHFPLWVEFEGFSKLSSLKVTSSNKLNLKLVNFSFLSKTLSLEELVFSKVLKEDLAF